MPTAGGAPRRLTDHRSAPARRCGRRTPAGSPTPPGCPSTGRYGTVEGVGAERRAAAADHHAAVPAGRRRLPRRPPQPGLRRRRAGRLAGRRDAARAGAGDRRRRRRRRTSPGARTASVLAFVSARHDGADARPGHATCTSMPAGGGAPAPGHRRPRRLRPPGLHRPTAGRSSSPPARPRARTAWTSSRGSPVPCLVDARRRRAAPAARPGARTTAATPRRRTGARRRRRARGVSAGARWSCCRVPLDGSAADDAGRRAATPSSASRAAAGVVVATVAPRPVGGRAGRDHAGTAAAADRLRPAARRDRPAAPLRERTATAPDGYPVHGWVTAARGPGPHPVLLTIHGGPFAQYGWTFFDEAQVYVSAGYAVVQCNPRGSAGYGQAHGRAHPGAWGRVDADDVLALLDAALEDPALDADRVGVMGGSYGGYLTTLLLGRTTRFAAAIERAGLPRPGDASSGRRTSAGSSPTATSAPTRSASRAQSADGRTPRRSPRRPWSSTPSTDWRCPVEQGSGCSSS